jgi:hypothetical protein
MGKGKGRGNCLKRQNREYLQRKVKINIKKATLGTMPQ